MKKSYGAVAREVATPQRRALGLVIAIFLVGVQVRPRPQLVSVKVEAMNDYEKRFGRIMNGAQDELGFVVLELFQPTTLRLEATRCEWHLAFLDDDARTRVGCEIEVEATQVGEYESYVAYAGGRANFVILARYVRREMRDLTRRDFDLYLNGVHAMWKSSSYLANKHLIHSAQKECDSWHGNANFLVAHVAFTMEFEQLLQAKEPRTCAHYWDYTIDAARGEGWVDSPVFEWYGRANNRDHIVSTSTWAYTPLTRGGNVTNAYGLLMAPWNTIRTPFVTRSQQLWGWHHNGKLVDCAKFKYGASQPSFAALISFVDVKLHSKVHAWLGGAWNNVPEIIASEQLVLDQLTITNLPLLLEIKKRLWRSGVARCPDYCGFDGPCECVLNSYFENMTAFQILDYTGAFLDLWDVNITNVTAWDEILHEATNTGWMGTMLSDGSPQDPMFWIIHQMQERLFFALRWYKWTGGLVFDDHYGDPLPHHYFDWSVVDGYPYLPNMTWSRSCPGTLPGDLMAFENLLRNTPTSSRHTNVEFYNMTGPFSIHTNYVYDHLTNFTQCGDIVKQEGTFSS
ncbi:hypothetical protein CTAYLR_007185 [Chrysophaeum taylorii]|uniref:Tyrosinase copper-binding domain-containing protein n=1 Tax=Chrysophaeum taylorii TaxID=2483200 RepID=A0AAD7UKI4_9STRA|nr:hypothetical protein CTAYLR_007185 [Chrysophaeum taylorii]